MKTEQIALARASTQELRAFCRIHNLEIEGKDGNLNSLRAIVRKSGLVETVTDDVTGAQEAFINLPTEVALGPQPMVSQEIVDMQPPNVPAICKPFLKVQLTVAPGTKSDTRSCYVAVDGRNMLIPRGEQVTVDYKWYEALWHAKKWEYPETEDGLGEPYEAPSYPFTVYGFIRKPGFEAKLAEARRIEAGREAAARESEAA